MSDRDRAAPARQLIRRERHGVLCTLSTKIAGWPFGSTAPYAWMASGEPVILISEIAEHTRNLRADPRVSLFIQDSSALDDPQTGARITLMGQAEPVSADELSEARARYLARFPSAESFFQVHDFTLFKLKIEHVRFIGGFGEIYWLEPDEVLPREEATDPIAPIAAGICAHMNADHADALVLYCAAYGGLKAESARMVQVDARGFELLANSGGEEKRLRIECPHPVSTGDEVRQVMIEMLKRARQQLGERGAA